jgi:hypothetical protein
MGDTLAQNLKMEVLTIENAPAMVGHCLTLINSKYESHTSTGVKACSNVFNIFRDVSFSLANFYIAYHASQVWDCKRALRRPGERKQTLEV